MPSQQYVTVTIKFFKEMSKNKRTAILKSELLQWIYENGEVGASTIYTVRNNIMYYCSIERDVLTFNWFRIYQKYKIKGGVKDE